MGLRLGAYFGVDPQFWLSLQSAHDMRTAMEGNGAQHGQGGCREWARCALLQDRRFVLRETRSASGRGWEVLLTPTRSKASGAATSNDGRGRSNQKAKNVTAKTSPAAPQGKEGLKGPRVSRRAEA
jgi:hypothetical protein